MRRAWPSRRLFLLGALASIAAPRAFAQAGEARALYRAGDFIEAAAAGERAGGADNLIVASRALLAMVVIAPQRADAGAMVDRALRNAEAALAASPGSVDALLQLAAALGMKGRRSSLTAAIGGGYAPRGRRLIQQALAQSPDEPWGRALLGGWHLEVLRRGGRAGAAAYGARLREGMDAFDRARVLAPGDIAIAVHYGLALIALNPVRHQEKVESLFQAASACAPRDALEAHLRRNAARLAHVLIDDGAFTAQRAAAAAFP